MAAGGLTQNGVRKFHLNCEPRQKGCLSGSGDIESCERLGSLLKYYYRKAG